MRERERRVHIPVLLNKYHTNTGWRAPLFPIGTKGRPVIIGQDLELVFSCLLQLFNTRRGERAMYRDFGWDHGAILWDPYDRFLFQEITIEIRTVVSRWEPRAQIISVAHDPNPRLINLGILIVSLELVLINNPRMTHTVLVPISSQGSLFKTG